MCVFSTNIFKHLHSVSEDLVTEVITVSEVDDSSPHTRAGPGARHIVGQCPRLSWSLSWCLNGHNDKVHQPSSPIRPINKNLWKLCKIKANCWGFHHLYFVPPVRCEHLNERKFKVHFTRVRFLERVCARGFESAGHDDVMWRDGDGVWHNALHHN